MISYTDFRRLILAAPDCDTPDLCLAEEGGSIDAADLALLPAIWSMAHDGLTIKAISAACELPVRQIALQLGLPQRTVENWASGVTAPPAWQLPLIAYAVLHLAP